MDLETIFKKRDFAIPSNAALSRLVPELRRPKSAEFPMFGAAGAALAGGVEGVEGTREQDQG